MANLTIAVDDDVLRRARVRAAEQGTSVNAVLREELVRYADPAGSDRAVEELLAITPGYSRSHFLRMFRATTEVTPHRYVLKRRLERARQLLEKVEPAIEEIAFVCGFSSPAHLTLAFRKEFGITPTEYRRHL